MFDHAGRQVDRRHQNAADELDLLDVALRSLGFLPPRRYGRSRNVVGGAALRISVREVLDDGDAGRAHLHRLAALVGEQVPVNLSAEDFHCEMSAIESWQGFCTAIRNVLSRHTLADRHLGLCIHAHQMPLEAYRLIADAVLGHGPRYVFLDNLQMSAHCNPEVAERAEANWSFLWRQQGSDRPVMPVYGGVVRSTCPLLADEVAATILPGTGLNTPVGSAWLPITLPMTAFATPAGQVRWRDLGDAIARMLSLAEQMHGKIHWPERSQQEDAHENRRLALLVTELGDVVKRRGDDPASLPCLRWIASVVTRLRDELRAQSRQIACRQGPIPALEEANHVRQWRAGPHRESWRRHWEEALRHSAVRHRNMLAISPYSIIPSDSKSAAVYADLLPAIALADAWAFAAPPDLGNWDIGRYRNFHRRARATIQGSDRASFIAAGV